MEFTEHELRTLDKLAYRLAGAHGVDAADVYQEMALWAIEHEAKVEEFRAGKRGLYTALLRVGLKYVKREQARLAGYDLSDNYDYSRSQLRDMLPHALDEEWFWKAGQGVPEGRPVGDPSEGGNQLAMLVDIRAAVDALPPEQAVKVRQATDVGFDYYVLGELWTTEDGEPIGYNAARLRCDSYLDNMRRTLNGEVGLPERVESDSDAESFYRGQLGGYEEYTGTRGRVSSDEAAAIYRRQYGG